MEPSYYRDTSIVNIILSLNGSIQTKINFFKTRIEELTEIMEESAHLDQMLVKTLNENIYYYEIMKRIKREGERDLERRMVH